MTLFEFDTSHEIEQAEAIWRGSIISNREDNGYLILLYRINNFYVEAYYDTEYNTLHKFKSYACIDKLVHYKAVQR